MVPLAAGLMLMGAPAAAQQDTARRTAPPPLQRMDDRYLPSDDERIVGAAVAANEAEIALAELALSKTKDTAVRDYALMLRRDHASALEKLRPLAKQANPASADDPDIRDMKRDHADQHGMLSKLDTAAFDSLFAEQMVLNHTKMLTMIDTKFLPKAQGADLRSTLQGMRPTVQAHLRQAEALKNRGPDSPIGARRDSVAKQKPRR
jgi:putative membrane protein